MGAKNRYGRHVIDGDLYIQANLTASISTMGKVAINSTRGKHGDKVMEREIESDAGERYETLGYPRVLRTTWGNLGRGARRAN